MDKTLEILFLAMLILARFVACFVVGCCVVLPARAEAETEEGPPAEKLSTEVTPPRLEYDPGVAYPLTELDAHFFEDVTVELVLDIDTVGGVTNVSVEHPVRESFKRAAILAARSLRFAPALRHGKPVPSRIRYRYLFSPASPLLSGRVYDVARGEAVPAARVTLEALSGEMVVVLDVEADGTFRSLGLARGPLRARIVAPGWVSEEVLLDLAPGSEVQLNVPLVRAVDAAPPAPPDVEPALEVTVQGEKPAPAVTSLSRAEVRELPGAFGDPFRAIEALPGVTPIGSGFPYFYVRGAPPGNVGYFLDGIRIPYLYHVAIGPSVLHPGLVERVDLYSGGYPARFGRFAGGIVAAQSTEPRAELHGEANLRLFDAGALAESGFDAGRGTLLLGARYSYTAALFSLLVPDLSLDYRDYQARLSYDLSDKDRLSVLTIGAYDLLAQEQGQGLNVLFGAEFYRVAMSHERQLGAGALRTSVNLGYDQSHNGDEGNSRARSLTVRSDLSQPLLATVRLRGGADASFEETMSFALRYVDPEAPEVTALAENNPDRLDRTFGVYGDLVLDVAPRVEVMPGVRLDLYQSLGTSTFAFDPRLAGRFSINEHLTLVHTLGLVHQPPSFVVPLPGRSSPKLTGGLQQSIQSSAGAEVALGTTLRLTGTIFLNIFSNMSDGLSLYTEGPPDVNVEQRTDGYAAGAEVLLRRSLTERLGGYVSYTLSRSMRSAAGATFPSSFDRTHVANAALAYDLGRGYRLGGRLVFYTGTPVPEDTLFERVESPVRGTPFYRIDLRFEKKWTWSERVWLSLVVEVLNATLSKETFGDEEVGPITLPSLGVELGF